MSILTRSDPKWAQHAQGVLRIVIGYLFLQHATAKLFGFPHVAYFDNLKLLSLNGIAGLIELVGAPLMILGLFTQPVALLLSGEMAIGYFVAHAPQGHFFAPMLNQGEGAVMYCFVFLFFAAAGAGSWSVDASRGVARAR